MEHPLLDIVRSRKLGLHKGICSICSANEYVIEAAMERAKESGSFVLAEATANQVNQFGGYTGMKPADFRDFVFRLAEKAGFPRERIILGGDHLGPVPWKDEDASAAMEKAEELVAQFVLAGFTKIHIDTSMRLMNDRRDATPDTGLIAERGAALAMTAEKAFGRLREEYPDALHPVYVIGSEVPIPGGSREEEAGLQITKPADFEDTIELFAHAFESRGLAAAWDNVVAVVVQPGVEFGDDMIREYRHEDCIDLISSLKKYPNLVFEGHSTDYQTAGRLRQMADDGIAILKVGPALTFALREALFALNYIENEMFRGGSGMQPSRFIEALDAAMTRNPEYWKKYYRGNGDHIRFSMKYSLSDRCRYYLPFTEVRDAMERLICNLNKCGIPLTLVSQFMPEQYRKIRNGILKNDAESLIKDRIGQVLDDYSYAVGPQCGGER